MQADSTATEDHATTQIINREVHSFTLHYVKDGQRMAEVAEHISDLIPKALELSKGGVAYVAGIDDEGALRVAAYRDGAFIFDESVNAAHVGYTDKF